VGDLSLAACLFFGKPFVIFFQGIAISAQSQNTFSDFAKFFKVAVHICTMKLDFYLLIRPYKFWVNRSPDGVN
jgi:hypothetical protein